MKHFCQADLEDLVEVQRAPGFLRVREFLARAREDKIRDLVQPSGAEQTASLRGFIQGLEFALTAPETLSREVKAKLKGQSKEDPG